MMGNAENHRERRHFVFLTIPKVLQSCRLTVPTVNADDGAGPADTTPEKWKFAEYP